MNNDGIVSKIFDSIKDSVVKRTVMPELIMNILTGVMELVEMVKPGEGKTLSGPAKKNIVLQVVDKVIEELAPPETQEQLHLICKVVLPGAVDAIVAATKHQFAINMQKIKEKGCGSCCVPRK